jgi:hypothetical protein
MHPHSTAQFLAGNVAFYTWPSLGCPSAIGWREELVAVVGRPTTAVLRGKGRFAFVGMFPHVCRCDTVMLIYTFLEGKMMVTEESLYHCFQTYF